MVPWRSVRLPFYLRTSVTKKGLRGARVHARRTRTGAVTLLLNLLLQVRCIGLPSSGEKEAICTSVQSTCQWFFRECFELTTSDIIME